MVKIIIAEDHPLMVDSLEKYVHQSGLEAEVIGIFPNGMALLQSEEISEAAILLLDLNLPKVDGVECAKVLSEKHPTLKIIVFSMNCNKDLLKELLPLDIKGYVLKNNSGESVVKAVLAVNKGEKYFDDDVMKIIHKNLMDRSKHQRPNKSIKFTDLQLEIGRLMLNDFSTDEIADRLNRSTSTVRGIRAAMYEKTGTHTIGGLIGWLVSKRLIRTRF